MCVDKHLLPLDLRARLENYGTKFDFYFVS